MKFYLKYLYFLLYILLIFSCNKREGCTDANACNFDSAAEENNYSCTYPSESYLDCAGGCITDTDNDGTCDVNDLQPDCATDNEDACGNCGGDCVTNYYLTSITCSDNIYNIVTADLCGICSGNGCYEQNCTDWPSGSYDCNGINLIDVSVIQDIIELNVNLLGQNTEDVGEQIWSDSPDSRLISLSINGQGIDTLPNSIGNLTYLSSLDLSSNDIASIPEAISQINRLKNLNLSANNISSIPEPIWDLDSLYSLDLSVNSLTMLSGSIKKLSNLTSLNLSANNITSLPDSIGNLTSLSKLIIQSNQLSSLPETIGSLSSLTTLHVFHNYLTSLPESIVNLTSLIELFLYHNCLTSLPNSLCDLDNININLVMNNLPDDYQSDEKFYCIDEDQWGSEISTRCTD